MSAFHTLSSNFNGGLVTPKMSGRFDLDKLKSGCVELKNMLVSPYGGVFKRPGTQFVQRAIDDAEESRLLTIRATGLDTSTQTETVTESIVLEIGSDIMVPTKNRAVTSPIQNCDIYYLDQWNAGIEYKVGDYIGVYSAGPNTTTVYYCTEDHTGTVAFDSTKWSTQTLVFSGNQITEYVRNAVFVPVPDYYGKDLGKLQFIQINDVTFLVHPDIAPHRLIVRDGQLPIATSTCRFKYRFEPVPFDFAPALDVNETLTNVQVQYDYNDWATSTSYVVGSRVIGTDGKLYTCYSAHTSAGGTAPVTGTNYLTVWNPGTSSANIPAWASSTIYVAGTSFVKYRNVIYKCTTSHTSTTPTSGAYGWIGGNRPGTSQLWAKFWEVSGGDFDLSNVAFKLVATESLFTAEDEDTIWRIQFGVEKYFREMIINGSSVDLGPTESIFVQNAFTVSTNWKTGFAPISTLVLSESADGVIWRELRRWEILDVDEGNISYAGDGGSTGTYYRLSGYVTSGGGTAKRIRIEPATALLTFPFKINTYTDAKNVKGELIIPGSQLPPINVIGVASNSFRKPAFSAAQGYPSAVAFHDLRLWFGGTRGQPARIWASQTDDFYNFLTGSQDTDALDITLGATKRNEIKWLQSFNRVLVVGTNLQEWTIDGGDEETSIKPSSFRARLRTNYGSGDVAPIVIEEALLWSPNCGKKLLEFAYNFQSDGYTAPDLSIFLGPRLGVVKRMAFMRNPFPCLWVVNEDGQLFSFFYDRAQELTAWSIHLTGEDAGDIFEDVVTTDEVSDQVWFVVRRSLGNSQYGRFIEKMDVNINTALASDTNHDTGSAMSFDPVHLDCSLPRNPEQSGANTSVTTERTTASASSPVWGPFVGRSLWLFQNGANFSIAGPSDSIPNVSPYNAVFPNFTNLAGNYQFGFQIKSTIQGFPVEVMLRDGTGQGRKWRPNRITFLMQNSHGGAYGDTLANATQPIEYPRSPAPVFTGRTDEDLQPSHFQADWRNYSQVAIVHNDPSPFGLLGYILTLEVEGE
jgi:hypothetical protein